MAEPRSRRRFLKEVALGSLALAAPGSAKTPGNTLLSIRPLSFQWETADPFLFCVHHLDEYPAGNGDLGPAASLEGRDLGQDFQLKDGWRMYHGGKVPGFPEHPHRGFETVTVVRRGLVDHSDSLGAAGRYGGGDVQWMTAGSGIQHSEMFPLLDRKAGNTLELFQIWMNLPRSRKMAAPHFKMLWREDIPVLKLKDAKGKAVEVTLIAGALGGLKPQAPPPDSWAADAASEVAIWIVRLAPEATWTLPPAGAGVNRTLYFFKGKTLAADGADLPPYHAASLRPDASVSLANGPVESGLLLLQAKPIGEPVVKHGPFVMNTQEEIAQAFADYRKTQFGGWPWKDSEPVHGREKGRFARHSDGREETRKG